MFSVNQYLDSLRIDKRTKDLALIGFTVILFHCRNYFVKEFRVRIERLTSVWRFWWGYVY